MPSSFPASLDSFTNPAASDPQNSPSHSQQHENANDAIEAIEAKIGVDGSADPDSIDARLAAVEAADHTHVWADVPTGAIDGVNAVFTLAHSPSPTASLLLFLNGILQRAAGNDFTLSGATVTFVEAPQAGSYIVAHYVM